MQDRAEQTRNAILDAAAEVFDEDGLNGASVADILARAGVTKGALYFHFSSKEDLAKAITDEQLKLELPPITDPSTAVQGMIDTCHVLGQQLRDNVRVRASHRLVIESPPSQVIDVYQHWINALIKYLAAAKIVGDVKDEWEPEAAALWVAGSYLGVQILSGVFTQRADLRDRITELWQHVLLPALVPPDRLSRFDPAGNVRWDAGEAPQVST